MQDLLIVDAVWFLIFCHFFRFYSSVIPCEFRLLPAPNVALPSFWPNNSLVSKSTRKALLERENNVIYQRRRKALDLEETKKNDCKRNQSYQRSHAF